jgi:flagellar hook-associated protein 1 FlgK
MDLGLQSADGATLTSLYDQLAADTTQSSAVARSVAEGFRVFEETLRGEQLGLSGVSLDEEAVRLITYQRAYQAAARYIATINDLLDVLVNL